MQAASLMTQVRQSLAEGHKNEAMRELLRTMALDGRGMAWLPHTLIREDLAAGRLVEAAPQDWTLELEIRLYRDRSPMGHAAEAFWSAVCAAAK